MPPVLDKITFAADGSFTFNPSPGFEGSTTFTYTVNDGTFNSTGTVTVTVTGMIWFINAAAPGGGDGRLNAPFNTMNAFNASSLDGTGDNIFVYTGTYNNTGNTALLGNQNLIGQGAVGTLAALAGVTFSVHPPIAPNPVPSVGGTNPVINQAGNSLTLGSNNDVLGVTLNNTSGTTFSGNAFATVLVRNVILSNTGGIALNLTNGTLNAIFQSISASNASHGIRLQNTPGSFEVTGTGTTDGTGGTISTITTRGIEIITASNITLRNMTLTNANTLDAGGDTVCDEDQNTACNAAIYLTGITGTNLFNNVDITTTQEHGINGNDVSNLSMTNCTIIGAGAAANVNDLEEDAFKFIDLKGTCNFTGCTFQNSFRRNGHIRNNSGNINLTINNCNFSNTAFDITRFDCFEMRTLNSATGTVNISNSTFARAGSKGIQIVAQESSTLTVNITNCSVQRFGNPMAGIEVASVGSASVMNYNVNNNPVIESSGEVAVSANAANGGDLNGRSNNNTSITNTNATGTTFPNIGVVNDGNGQAIVEIKDNPSVVSSNTDLPVRVAALNGTNAAARVDITLDNNNITNSTTTSAGLEGIVLRVGTATMGTKINTICGNVKNNALTLPATVPLPTPAPYPRAFRAHYLDPGSFFNLQGGTSVATHWTSNNNTNTNGAISQGPTLTYTFSGTCATPTHAFAPTEEELLMALTENAPSAEVATTPEAVVQTEPVITDEPVVAPPMAMTMFSGETITVGGAPGFPLPAGQTMTIVFRVTIDNPFPVGVCTVSNQGTVTGGNFANVLTDDPGVAGPANPTVTTLNIAPTITLCQDNITTGTDPGLCTASESFSATAVGCPAPTLTYRIGPTTITSPHVFPIGTTTVDVTASNGVLPNATCSFTVTVTDTQAPDITCLVGTQMRGTNLGNCSYTVSGSEFNPSVNENCPGFTLTNDFNNTNTLAGALLPTGTTVVVWTITDGAMLTDMCSVTILVTDDDAPTLTCPAAASTPCNIADLPPYASLTEFTNAGGSASDNCGINSGSFMLLSQTGGPLSFIRTYQIADINGLTSTCTQTVTVNDNVPPTVTPGTIAACYPTVAAAEAAAIAATTAVDGCPGSVTKTASTVGTCMAVITVTATDGANNSASTSYMTRIDGTAPMVTQGMIDACYPTVAAAEAAALVATSATDNCPGTLTEVASTVGTCAATITVTTSDICGNSASVTYMTSIDNESPTVTTGTIALCYPTVAAAEAAAIAATTVNDDCAGTATKTASTTGTCSAVITVTATDACNNSASTTYNTRIDGAMPTPTVVGIAACYPTVAAAEAAALVATTWSDNCSSPAYLETQESASTVGDCSAVITVTTMDECGNVGTATYNTRIDNTPPNVTQGTIASCYPTAAAAEAAALAATSATDNCDGALTEVAIVTNEADCAAVITVTTTDGCGNFDVVTYNTRIDNTPPTVTAGMIATCYPTVAAAEAAAIAATTTSDNCTGTVTKTASTMGTCTAVITVTATDGCGNSATATYNTRIDNTPPTVTVGSIESCYSTVELAEAAALAATSATDNCPGMLTETVLTEGTCTATVTVTTTDGCGNSTEVTYTTRIDNAGPTVMTGTIAACYPTVAAAEAAAIAATTAMDDCPSSITKTASTMGTCEAVITVTATDGCGNSATTMYNTRIDGTPPTPTAGSIAACYPTVAEAEAAALAATSATDNCDGTLTETASTVGDCSAVITVTTTDGCGNSAIVTYNTRIDNTAPTVITGTIAACYPTVAAAEAAALAATSATDNCDGALTETAATVGDCFAVITVTTTDGCGNSATTTYNTRIDNTAPTVTAGTIAACYSTVAAAEAAALAATSATDNCPGALTETASTVGDCFAVITVTTTDGCGNSASVTYNTRIDNTPPTVTVGTLAACYPTVAAAQAAALAATSATDNCPGTLTETASTVGTCTAVVTVTTTDGCGNSTQVTYNTRIDNVGPTVTPGTIAACYPTVAAAEAAAIAATTANDDCPSSVTKTASTVGTCSAVVTVTATDGCGNSASTTYNTRIDNTPPTPTAGSIAACYQTVAAAEAAALAATTATDNCPGVLTETASTVGTCSAVVTVTTTDGCGNSATVTYNTRIDNTAPTVTPGTIASCYPTVAAAEAAALAATSATDNCSGTLTETASTTGTCSAVVSVTTTDGCGNSTTVTYNTRIDNTPPTVTPGTIATCYTTVAAAEAAAIAATTATDNCTGTVTKTASTVGLCSAVVTVTATDFCGNSATTTYTTNIDNTPPTVVCKNSTVFVNSQGAYTLLPSDVFNASASSDNCPGTLTVVSITPATVTCAQKNTTIPVTVVVADACNNQSTCISMITVDEDNALPPGWDNSDVGVANGSAVFSPCTGENGSFVLTSLGFGTSPLPTC